MSPDRMWNVIDPSTQIGALFVRVHVRPIEEPGPVGSRLRHEALVAKGPPGVVADAAHNGMVGSPACTG